MDLQEIYNIIIAAVPSLASIITALILAIKVISSLIDLKHSVHNGSENVNKVVEDLKAANSTLQAQVIETNNAVSEIVEQINKLLDHSQDVQGTTDATAEEVAALKEKIDEITNQQETLNSEVNVLCQK